MSKNEYVREAKKPKPILAICYDFEKTLSSDDIQAQSCIQLKDVAEDGR